MLKTDAEILVSEASDLLMKAMKEDETPETLANKSVERMTLERDLWDVINRIGALVIKEAEELDRLDGIESKIDIILEKMKNEK